MALHSIETQHPAGLRQRHRMMFAVCILTLGVVASVASPAEAATRIRFQPGAYCAKMRADFRQGREYVLKLRANQLLSISNLGAGDLKAVSVQDASGDGVADYEWFDDDTVKFDISTSGDHFVTVITRNRRNTIQFCAS